MIATTSSHSTRLALAVVCLLTVWTAAPAAAERVAHASFRTPPVPGDWTFAVSHPEGVRSADQLSGPRREDARWVLRLGATKSSTRFAPVALDSFQDAVVSWVMRVERARWNDDAFFEVRVRGAAGEERVLRRWDAAALRRAKPGRGNFESAPLPPELDPVEVVVEARASVARGAAWFDVFDLRVDATNRAQLPARPLEWERPPYLQQVGTDRATLRWRSRYPARALLRWWPAAGNRANAREWRSRARATDHEAELSELSPDTRYRYEIELGGKSMAEGAAFAFRTAPTADTEAPVGVWVIGDSGMCGANARGCEDAARVHDAFARVSTDTPTSLWLLLGDNAYPFGTDWQYTQALFQLYARRTATTPLWSVLGNHDVYSASSSDQSGAYFDAFSLPTAGELGGVPSGTEAYYAFNWGPIHFVALDSQDSDRSAQGAMARWLEADLAASASARWRIALFHHPPYTAGSHDSDDPDDSGRRMIEMREVFLPILERHGVDLVLSGHSHGYERSGLIHGHYGASSSYHVAAHAVGGAANPGGTFGAAYRKARGPGVAGTVYAVVGSASEASTRMRRHPVMERSLATLGSLWLVVEGFSLRGRFVDGEGAVLDDFEIRKVAAAVAPKRETRGVPPTWLAIAVAGLAALALAAVWRGRRVV